MLVLKYRKYYRCTENCIFSYDVGIIFFVSCTKVNKKVGGGVGGYKHVIIGVCLLDEVLFHYKPLLR